MSNTLAFVRALASVRLARLGLFALYAGKVTAQRADGAVDVLPDSPLVPVATNVPVRLGIPGAVVRVKTGTRVQLGFSGGSPRAPFAYLVSADDVISVSLGGDGGRPVACVGDAVQAPGPDDLPIPPGGIVFTNVAAGLSLTNAQPVTLKGSWLRGSSKVLAVS